MGKSDIEWTTYTWNVWYGCIKVSPACRWCYAEKWARRTGMMSTWGGPRERTSEATWNEPFGWNHKAVKERRIARVFPLSLGDFFDNQIPSEWRDHAWDVIRRCRHLDWLILSKRPQNIPSMLPPDWKKGWPHVWLGATVENMIEAQRRVPCLLEIPARVHWLSCEPLLGPLDLRPWLGPSRDQIRWIVVGGETGGPNDRATDPQWMADLRDQCRDSKAKFFLKQMWRKKPIPKELMVRQYPRTYVRKQDEKPRA